MRKPVATWNKREKKKMTDRENEILTQNYNYDKHAERQLKKTKKKEKMRN
jgi:hypothetical protein